MYGLLYTEQNMTIVGKRQVAKVDMWDNSIRHSACELLIPSGSARSVRCRRCMSYRGCLRVMLSRATNKSSGRTDAHSCTPHHTLSTEEMLTWMKNLHDELARITKQRNRLREKLDKLIDKNGVTVSKKMSRDLKDIMKTECNRVMEDTGSTYFQKVSCK